MADVNNPDDTILGLDEPKEKEGKRWLYLDVGRYSGLAETEGEAIKYKIEFSKSVDIVK